MGPYLSRRQCLVLLVEDDPDTYELYSEVLASAGFAVIGADNGADAVQAAVAHGPDLIVMDYELRGMDGASATEMLKGDARTRRIPVMMLTGHVARRQLDRARKAGCDAFLSKPCSLDGLIEETRRLTSRAAHPGRVLVVEDDEHAREAISELLAADGFEVLQAGNGREALELLHATEPVPQVILLDLMMPVMDGWTFRSRQLEDPRLAHIPVVILSANEAAREHCRDLRVEDFVRKPFNPPALLDAIGRHLAAL